MSSPSLRRSDDMPQPAVVRHEGRRWEVMPGAEEIVRSRSEWSFDTLRREFGDRLFKDKATRIVFPMDTPLGRVCVKSLKFDEFEVRLRSLFGRCRTRKEWENHLAAISCGVPTVRPLALGEIRKPLLVHQAVIITEWRDNTVTLNEWRRAQSAASCDAAVLRVAANIGRITAITQNAGIYHNEIKPDNLLMENPDAEQRLLLIDWKHARIKPRTLNNDLQNLLRLGSFFDRSLAYAPPTDDEKRAFFSAYLQARSNRPDRAKLIAELKRSCPNGTWIDL